LLSRFYVPGFQDKEIKLALGFLSESLDVMPDVFWTEKISRSHLQNLISDIARAHEDETNASFCDYCSLISAAQETSPPFETFYLRPSARRKCLASLEQMYAASSYIDFSSQELPDHISLELHHLYFLSVNEAEAILEDQTAAAVEFRRKQATFLWKHLRAWLPGFSNATLAASQSKFAASLAKAADLFTELDAMYLSFLLIKTTDLFTELDSISRSSLVSEKLLLLEKSSRLE
jgi:TorA maturation chaperone TorD